MRRVTRRSKSKHIGVVHYSKFLGVDFSTDSWMVNRNRSPYAPNMMSDIGGVPTKRLGWRKLWTLEAPINCIFSGVIGGHTRFVAHGGTKLYAWADGDTEPAVLHSDINNRKSTMFVMDEKLWMLTGREYLVFDGETVKDVRDEAYVPVTVIARAPTGGGTSYEKINLVGKWRKNYFKADGTSKKYKLDATELDADPVTVEVNGTSMTEGNGFTVNRATGEIDFTVAPAKPTIDGQDNVFPLFAKTTDGYYNRIAKCTISTTFGMGTSDRAFFTGNSEYRNWDWYSALNDPSYIPDLNYSIVGVDGTAIMGYRRVGSQLAVIKEDNGQDNTIFLRTAEYSGGEVSFTLRQGVAGVGALSPYAFANLIDEPLFLSSTGVYAITSNIISSNQTVRNRSYFVNAQLTTEVGLHLAVATEYRGYYVLAVNGRCYIMDGKQNKAYQPQSNGEYVYECYCWEDVPAICLYNEKHETGESLYFGTADGEVCRFNDDITTLERFNDYPNGMSADPRPIYCAWATNSDDDGDISRRKSMPKDGNLAMLKPYEQSSVEVCFRTDKDAVDWRVRTETIDVFNWDTIDFERGIDFNSNDAPRAVHFKKKVRDYQTVQIILRNMGLNEGFGVLGITRHYTLGGISKGR